ncbi:MAG: hypothetical protein WCA35_16960 [Kovacikia sp.]
MEERRLLYEQSVSYRGYLIIPFCLGTVGGETIYSYKLLSELGHRGKFHKAENPWGRCVSVTEQEAYDTSSMTDIAKDFLDENSDIRSDSGYFNHRYTYRNHLIITIQEAGKWFYDHYPPEELNNIAAPKIFNTEHECLEWIQRGLSHNYPNPDAVQLASD